MWASNPKDQCHVAVNFLQYKIKTIEHSKYRLLPNQVGYAGIVVLPTPIKLSSYVAPGSS